MSDPGSGEARIGCTEVMAAGLVSAVIDRMSATYPRMEFQLEVGNAATRLDLLRHRKCELVIGRHRATDADRDLHFEPLFHERLYVAVGPGSRFLRKRTLSLADLGNEAWILTRDEVGDHSPLAEAYRLAKCPRPTPRIVSDSLNLRKSLLPTDRFVSTMPGSILAFASPAEMKPLRIKLPPWKFPIVMVTLKGSSLTPAARLFADAVREWSQKVPQ
jgi:DNA-binding transcriptional LysR family regulator